MVEARLSVIRYQIVGHQIEDDAQEVLVTMLLDEVAASRMDRHFRRRHTEDQPFVAEIDTVPLQNVAEKRAVRVSIFAIEKEMRACNHGESLVAGTGAYKRRHSNSSGDLAIG